MSKFAKRSVAVAIGAALVLLAGWRISDVREEQAGGNNKKKKGADRVLNVSAVESRTGSVREELLLTGALKAKEAVDITPKATGRVEKLYYEVGDRVEAGALVAELEDDELQQQVHRAEASIAVANASLAQREAEFKNAQASLQRAEDLFKEGLVSPQDFEQQKTGVAVVEAQVSFAGAQKNQVEAELRELRIRLAQSKIYSPLNGIVAQRYVDVGALVSPSTAIARVVNLSTLVTQGNVPERHIGQLRVGNEAVVTVDAIPDEPFTGRVARIAPVLDAATRSALIEIDISNRNGRLKAEMFARIHLDLGTTRDAILIPRDGLVYRGQQPGVFVVEGDRPVFRAIETGMTHEDEVEVLANLEPGTKIVGRGATMIREGDRVRLSGDGLTAPNQGSRAGVPDARRSVENRQPAEGGGAAPGSSR